jgi:hypothetical protein
MKKLKNLLLPVAVVLIGAGAAFATNTAKGTNNTLVRGYYIDNSNNQCIASSQMCSSETGDICTWTDPATSVSHNLRQLEGTSCGIVLFKP